MGFQAESAGMKGGNPMTNHKDLFIDSQHQVIQLDDDKTNRMKAESRNNYYHFCSLETLGNILCSKALKFNSIRNFAGADEYERNNVAPEFWGQVFVACLTNKKIQMIYGTTLAITEKALGLNLHFRRFFTEMSSMRDGGFALSVLIEKNMNLLVFQ